MPSNFNGIASDLAKEFVVREKQMQEFSTQTATAEIERQASIQKSETYLNENGKKQFNELAILLQKATQEINENQQQKMRFTGGGDTSHINIQYDGYVAFLYFKYLRTRGDGTGPCIQCYFGKEGTDVGNNNHGRVGELIPLLTENGNIIWGQNLSAQNPVGSIDDIAKMVLKWFHSEAKIIPGIRASGQLTYVGKYQLT